MPDAWQGIQLRLGNLDDLDAMAVLFSECNAASVWRRLGHRMAYEYVRPYCANRYEVAVVATEGERIVGVCLGTMRPTAYRAAFYKENAARLLRAFLNQVRSRPAALAVLVGRIVSGLEAKARAAASRPRGEFATEERSAWSTAPEPPNTCHMSLFFVSPSVRGRRVGPAMVVHFGREMSKRGFEWCRAYTTVDNASSRAALERAGLSCVARSGERLTFLGRINEMPT